MDAVIIPKDQFKALLSTVELIKTKLEQKQNPEEAFIDNQEFLMLMKVSKRTAQAWRDRGLIAYSVVGTKIYYKKTDINELLKKNYVRAFKRD